MVLRGCMRSQQRIPHRLCALTLTHVLPRVLPSISTEGDLDQNTRIEQENRTRVRLTSNHTQSLLSVIKN